MDTPPPGAHVIRFGVFELDTQSGELRRYGLKVRLPDQSFGALLALALGAACRTARRYDRSLNELRRAQKMSPTHNRINHQLGITLLAMGRVDEAILEFEIAAGPNQGHNSRFEAVLGYAYATAGRTGDARRVLQEVESHRKDQYVSWFGIGLIHDALNEKTAALAAVQRAFEDRAVEFGLVNQYPPFKTIASEAPFLSIMQAVGR